MIGYLHKVIKPLVLVSECVKTFKGKAWDKDKDNKFITFRIDDEKF